MSEVQFTADEKALYLDDMIIARKGKSAAFVTNELFIVVGSLALATVGAIVLARTLHLGSFLSTALVLAVVAIVVLVLSFVFSPRKRR
jgi:hypothetical protein